jgi:osmotically-inducible protein OsmY
MLSGFAKNAAEKAAASQLTWQVKGVKSVKNEIAIRP